jgi:epoxyqueuosine reductase
MGQWLFGCDLCQTCCPFEVNAGAEAVRTAPGTLDLDLPGLLSLSENEFRSRFRRTPFWRPRRAGLLRNAVIVVTNGEHREALPAVQRLLSDDSPVLREVASWGLMRLRHRAGIPHLEKARAREPDPAVREWMGGDLAVLGR